jgi:ParB/RepB/Spo0J family partition protein
MTNAQVLNIPLQLIETAPQVRTRFNLQSIAELAADIAEHGVLQPLIVQQGKNGKFTLLIGERRLRALLLNKAETAPAIIATVSAELASEVQLMENIQREDLNTKDLAMAIHGLWEKHGSIAEVGRRCHKSPSWVSKRLALALQCGPALTALLDAGVKDVELLYQFRKLEKIDPARALRLVPDVIAGTVGREAINDWIIGDPEDAEKEEEQITQQSNLFQTSAGADPKAGIEELTALKQQCESMKKALLEIATMKDLKALYKTRDAMRQIASECLATTFP